MLQTKLLTVLLILLIIVSIFGGFYIFVENCITSQPDAMLKNRRHVKFYIDSNFTKNEINIINDAMKDWKIASDSLVTFKSEVIDSKFSEIFNWRRDRKATIYDASSFLHWPSLIVFALGNYNKHLGLTTVISGDIFILHKDPNILKQIIIHEIGHVIIGNYHSHDVNDIMYPKLLNTNKSISENDLRALKEITPDIFIKE